MKNKILWKRWEQFRARLSFTQSFNTENDCERQPNEKKYGKKTKWKSWIYRNYAFEFIFFICTVSYNTFCFHLVQAFQCKFHIVSHDRCTRLCWHVLAYFVLSHVAYLWRLCCWLARDRRGAERNKKTKSNAIEKRECTTFHAHHIESTIAITTA